MRYIYVFIFILLISGQYVYAIDFKGLLKNIENKGNRHASFIETRTAFFLDKPLITKGRLEFRLDGTLIKHITFPEIMEQRIIGDELFIYQKGLITKTIILSQSSELEMSINAIRWLLMGNYSAIKDNYIYEINGDNDNWKIDLTPKDGDEDIKIEKIIIVGRDKYIGSITKIDVSGDEVVMDLYDNQ